MWVLIEPPLECGGRRRDDTIAFAQYHTITQKKHTITIHEEDSLPIRHQFVGGVRERMLSKGSVSSETYFPVFLVNRASAHL